MTEAKARAMVPVWTAKEAPYSPQIHHEVMKSMNKIAETFIRKHMITIILAALMLVEGVVVGAGTAHRVRRETEERLSAQYAADLESQMEAYKQEQAYQEQAAHWLSGDASREAFLNQEIDAGTQLIQDEPNETMRGTKLGVALARLMSGNYGSTLQEVVEQPDQWMNYSKSTKITQEVRAFAEKIIRAYYEDGIVPDGLTQDIQWLTWTPGDYLARNNWNAAAATVTWRYHG